MIENFLFALFLTLLAGLSTAIGGLISFLMKKPSKRFISVVMGFSLGVMLFLSFTELLHHALNIIGEFMAYMFFFLGILLMFLIDIPITHKYHFERHLCKEVGIELDNNDNQGNKYRHQYGQVKDEFDENFKLKLQKTSFVILFGIFIHNFPEGMATMIGTLENIKLGVFLAFAIALHNIPEGIAVSVPICAATGDKKKGFRWALYSGLSEPIGGLIFGLIIYSFVNETILSCMLAIVAGIMVYISIDELLPVSHSFGKEHLSIAGIVLGMFLMAISLSLFPI